MTQLALYLLSLKTKRWRVPRVLPGLSRVELEGKVSTLLNLQPSSEEGLHPESHRLVGRHGMTCPDLPREAERLPTHSMWESAFYKDLDDLRSSGAWEGQMFNIWKEAV